MSRIPGIPYGPAPRAAARASALAQPPKLVVVHCTSNTASAAAEANYAATRTDGSGAWTSAHAYVDAGGPLGSLDLGLQAWAAYGWANARGWHVELCGRENQVPDVVQRIGAALVRQLCILGSIPMEHLDGAAIRALHDGSRTRGGVTGHYDITRSGIDNNDHTDPGSAFDWGRFMGWVNEGGGDDMGSVWDEQIGRNYTPGGAAYGDQLFRTAVGYIWPRVDEIKAAVLAGNAADEARDTAAAAAIKTLADALKAGGGNLDTAAVLARIDEVAAAESAAVAKLQEALAAGAAREAELHQRLAQAYAD